MSNDMSMLALSLPVGETMRDVCPKCGGGSDNERTFTMSRVSSGEVRYYCHRASCGHKGIAGTSPLDDRGEVARPESHQYRRRSRLPTLEEADWFRSTFGMNPPPSTRIDAKNNRWMYELREVTGRGWGHLGRSYHGLQPRALMYWHDKTEPNQLAWCRRNYIGRVVDSVVLTEDVVSAMKMSLYTDAASLMGTNLSDRKMGQLLQHVRGTIYLALDPDAAGQIATARAVRELSAACTVKVIQLTADPKDMTYTELGEALVRAKVIERSAIEPTKLP